MLAERAKGAAANRARYYLELAEGLSSDRSLMQPSLFRASLGSSSTTTCTEVPVPIKGDSAQSMRINAISSAETLFNHSQSVPKPIPTSLPKELDDSHLMIPTLLPKH